MKKKTTKSWNFLKFHCMQVYQPSMSNKSNEIQKKNAFICDFDFYSSVLIVCTSVLS